MPSTSHRVAALTGAYNSVVSSAFTRLIGAAARLPVLGGLIAEVRGDAARVLSTMLDRVIREHLDVDEIVARLAVEDVVARLDIDEIVRRLDIGDVVARLEMDEVVARLDLDAVIARLELDDIVARIDFGRLAGKVIDDVDLPRIIRRSASSVVRPRRSHE